MFNKFIALATTIQKPVCVQFNTLRSRQNDPVAYIFISLNEKYDFWL